MRTLDVQEICDQLNDYWAVDDDDDDLAELGAHLAGLPVDDPVNDIWRDVIHQLDGYDAEATARLTNGGLWRFAMVDGTVIHWDAAEDCWHVERGPCV